MWIIAVFDFPKHCRSGKKNMSDFITELEKDGFSKIQRGMYARTENSMKSTAISDSRNHQKFGQKAFKPNAAKTNSFVFIAEA